MSLLKKAASKGPRLRCSKCQVFFKSEDLGPDEDAVCSGCHAKYRLKVFPAFARKPVTLSDQDVLPLDDAHCYRAEDRRAVTKCDDCGRGVSEFMKVSLGANTVTCLTCLHEHREDGDELLLATRRTATDNRAFLLAALPLIVLPVTLISAFIALFFIVKDWSNVAWRMEVQGRSWSRCDAARFLGLGHDHRERSDSHGGARSASGAAEHG